MDTKGIKLLIVDDEVDLAEMISEEFIDEGYDVTVVHNSTAAIEELAANRFDVVICDYNLNPGDLKGDEILKQTNITEGKPLFYLSSGEVLDLKEIKSLGGAGVIEKPFDLDELLKTIKDRL